MRFRASFASTRLGTKVILGFLPPILLVVALVVVVARNEARQNEAADWVRHTHEAIADARGLSRLMADMETGQRGYVITRKNEFLDPYHAAKDVWPARVSALRELVGDNPSQVARVGRVAELESRWLKEAAFPEIEAARRGAFDEAQALIANGTGKRLVDDVRTELAAFVATEEALLRQRRLVVAEENERARRVLVAGVVAFTLLVLVLAGLIRRCAVNGIEPLVRLTREVARGGELSKIAVTRTDEFGELANSFNLMIDAVQEEQRRALHVGKLASIGQLAAGVGHEINNPLAAAMGNVELTARELRKLEPNLERLRKMNETKNDALGRVARIVEGLRTYARLDEEDSELVDAHAAIESTEALVGDLYRRKGVDLELHLGATRASFEGHPGKLQQVLMNLVGNAYDAVTARGRGWIRIETENYQDELVIRVADNGGGMLASVQERIFDAFYTTKPVGQGTGMGLSIVARIVDDANGRIGVESVMGEGAVFTLTFPTVQKESERPTSRDGLALDASEDSLRGDALVVDDEPAVREILRAFLESMGLRVDEAMNGTEGLERISSRKYDYVFSDMKMPDIFGDVFIERAHELPNGRSRYFLITGGVDVDYSSDQWAHFQTLINGVIPKPFTRSMVREVLESSDGASRSTIHCD